MTISIREARREDLGALVQFAKGSWFFRGSNEFYIEALMEQKLGQGQEGYLVAENGGKFVGYVAAAYDRDTRTISVNDLLVSTDSSELQGTTMEDLAAYLLLSTEDVWKRRGYELSGEQKPLRIQFPNHSGHAVAASCGYRSDGAVTFKALGATEYVHTQEGVTIRQENTPLHLHRDAAASR